MPIIRPQHERESWRPLKPWPDDCTVQWGGSGLVIGQERCYGTAFFEAFPAAGVSGFIRGEGSTVEAAEAKAFASFERHRDCHAAGGHVWTRARRIGGHEKRLRKGKPVPRVSTYTNGGAFCLRCEAFRTALPEIVRLGAWRDPLKDVELNSIMSGFVRPSAADSQGTERERRRSRLWRRSLWLRARMFGIDLPDHAHPEFALDPDADPWVDDAYTKACRAAVAEFYLKTSEERAVGGGSRGLEGLFDAMALRSLKNAAEEYLASRQQSVA